MTTNCYHCYYHNDHEFDYYLCQRELLYISSIPYLCALADFHILIAFEFQDIFRSVGFVSPKVPQSMYITKVILLVFLSKLFVAQRMFCTVPEKPGKH